MDEVHFKPFHKTYKFTAFAMAVGLIYPNSANRKIRYILILLMFSSVCPFVLLTLYNIYKCWTTRDGGKILGHSTVIGPFVGGFFKMFVLNYCEKKCKYLIDEITYDFSRCNELPQHHRPAVHAAIRNSCLYAEICWPIFLVSCVMTFPLSAAALTVYNQFQFLPEKYLVHDLLLPDLEAEARFETPYYETMFAYVTYIAISYAINYVGYDVFFAMCINHACLKMELFCMAMEDAVKVKTKEEMYDRVGEVIHSQVRFYSFADAIQDVFNTWIGIALIAATIQIGSCLYHVTEGYEFDFKYIVYTLGTVLYISQPCWYSSKLRNMCTESATRLYGCGWEARADARMRNTLAFMIARAQQPKEIVAFNMFAFNMELFVSIMQTSYSFYALMRS